MPDGPRAPGDRGLTPSPTSTAPGPDRDLDFLHRHEGSRLEVTAQELRSRLRLEHVDDVEVGARTEGPVLPADVDLLLVGAPDHAFGISRASTRLEAIKEQGPVISATIGVREWLDDPTVRSRLRCATFDATFDTKVLTPRLSGLAAKAIDKHLRSAGAVRACPPRTFSVNGKSGGLVDGELTAARAWAGTLIPSS